MAELDLKRAQDMLYGKDAMADRDAPDSTQMRTERDTRSPLAGRGSAEILARTPARLRVADVGTTRVSSAAVDVDAPVRVGVGTPYDPSEHHASIRDASEFTQAQKDNTLTIHDADKYNLGLLRRVGNLSKYIEDPIAFITNHVWNRDLADPDNLVFKYEITPSLYLFNKRSSELINETYSEVKDSSTLEQSKNIAYMNSVFKIKLGDRIYKYLIKHFGKTKVDKAFPPVTVGLKLPPWELLVFFWINQIFALNLSVKKSKIRFNITEENYLPLFFAVYFLWDKIKDGGAPISFVEWKPKVEYVAPMTVSTVIVGNLEGLLYALAEEIRKKNAQFTNENNYWRTGPTNSSALDINVISNSKNSPFFNPALGTFAKTYTSKLNLAQQVKKCANAKSSKKETALRLFYKEGNDDVLIGKIPKGGLGCATDLLEWKEAKQMLFDIESLQKGRANLNIPYYSALESSIKNLIPASLDISKAIPKAEQADLKTFNTLVTLDHLKEDVKGSSNLNLLIDESLTPFSIEDSLDTHAEHNYWAFIGNHGTNGGWGPDDFMSNLLTSNNGLVDFANLVPYVGLYSVGYVLEKYDSFDNLLQEFYINSADTKGTDKNGFQDAFTFLDSQVKYGKDYKYRLKQLIAFPSISYDWSDVELGKEFIKCKKDSDCKGTPQDRCSQGYCLGSSAGVHLNPDPSTNKQFKFKNVIKKLGLASADSAISFIDLPPKPTYMDVYPKRGINDRVVMVFGEYASSLFPEVVEIPKKYWLDGWDKAKDFYVKYAPQNPPLKDDDMVFMSAEVEKILIYRIENDKPTSEDDFTEIFDEVTPLFDGHSKEIILKPNTKYYFATRSITYSGLSSYLSEVYSIELVDDGGAVYPLISTIQLEKKQSVGKDKLGFTSAFRVEPALLQQAPDTVNNRIGHLDSYGGGSVFVAQGVTRPQFKIRLTSKKTGRKVDFNVIYQKTENYKGEEVGNISLSQTGKENILLSYRAFVEAGLGTKTAEASVGLGGVCKVDADCGAVENRQLKCQNSICTDPNPSGHVPPGGKCSQDADCSNTAGPHYCAPDKICSQVDY